MLYSTSYAVSDRVDCSGGECEAFIGVLHEKFETNCMDFFFMEEVEMSWTSFTVVETGQECLIY